jgi:hypothetical protein
MEYATVLGSMALGIMLFALGYMAGCESARRDDQEETQESLEAGRGDTQAIRVLRPRRSTADAEELVQPCRTIPGHADLVPYRLIEQ